MMHHAKTSTSAPLAATELVELEPGAVSSTFRTGSSDA
eukprot:CAMPEP_0205918084 /NCGR_PEP_ID=MMETSP1325-20131115/9577_1 /ASSEMBLY_ACC=CAM_ASM_000708 /TAXON_ID=236786 /ORGANISM="Florenciella sp., Strain RCC1007" /LENGTH=37 /DNA_ID= /DNA_START= /DNA_END= /DNA_ORIENTATION=